MVRDFGVSRLEARHFKHLLKMYGEKIVRLRESLRERRFLSLEDEEFLKRKIERLKAKYQAVLRELLKRVEMPVLPVLHDDGERVDLRARCPKCLKVVSLMKAVRFDEETRELYLKCPNCGVESRRLKVG